MIGNGKKLTDKPAMNDKNRKLLIRKQRKLKIEQN